MKKLSFTGKISRLSGLCIVLLFSVCSLSRSQSADVNKSIEKVRKGTLVVKAKPGANVEIEQLRHEFWFGAAIADGIFNGRNSADDVKQYKEKFLENFNSAVTENAVKWGNMERTKGQVNYANIDAMLEWTDKNEMPLRGHNLYWGIAQFVQPWIKELSDDELRQTLKNRGETVAARYKGRFAEYDLNNEMIHGNYYEDRLGPGITKQMAEWVHNGDPDAKLYLNDYDITTGRMLDKYMAHIRLLLSQGVPVSGIGVQGHLHAESFDRGELKRSLDSLAIFNLPICITEFNMPGQRSKFHNDRNMIMTEDEEAKKAQDIVDFYTICFAHPSVKGILMWGFWAGSNWIPASSLYNRDWSPTPALKAYQDMIYKQWWTTGSGKADSKGNYSAPAFYGKYKITVNGVTKTVSLKSSDGTATVDFN